MGPGWRMVLLVVGMLMEQSLPYNAVSATALGSSPNPQNENLSTTHEKNKLTTTAATEPEKSIPVKRFVGSVAREGKLPGYHGKREEVPGLQAQRLEEQLDKMKRYLGSVLRQGRRVPHSQALPMHSEQESEDHSELNESEEEEFLSADKRHLGSLARNDDLRYFGVKGRRFQSFPHFGPGKRHLASLVRGGSGGPSNRMAGKRYIGSLARTGDLPFRLKRSLREEIYPSEEEDISDNYLENEDEDGPFVAIGEDDDNSDESFLVEKKHVGSVARSGYVPYSRYQRRPAPHESSYRRHYKRRPSTSISARLRLLTWLQKEEERLNNEQKIQPEETVHQVAIHDKRNLAALARNGMLPAGYRISRSASREISSRERNAPPVMRMISERHRSVSPRMSGFIKAPHAFQSLYSNPWRRYKRSIGSIARQGMLRNKESTSFPNERCPEGSECSMTATTPEAHSEDVEKRHVSSLARGNQLPNGKRMFSEEAEEEEVDEGDLEQTDEDDDLFPYPEIIF